jgi:hypothetical protein
VVDAGEVIALTVAGIVLAALVCWAAVAVAVRVVRRRHDGAAR